MTPHRLQKGCVFVLYCSDYRNVPFQQIKHSGAELLRLRLHKAQLVQQHDAAGRHRFTQFRRKAVKHFCCSVKTVVFAVTHQIFRRPHPLLPSVVDIDGAPPQFICEGVLFFRFKSIHRSAKRVQYPADQGALADTAFSNDQRVHYLKNAFVVRVAYCSSVRVTP